MHAWLLYEDKDSGKNNSYSFQNDLIKDFNLGIVVRTMAGQDEQQQKIIRGILMHPLTTAEEVYYRQEIIRDVSEHYGEFAKLHGFLQEINTHVKNYRELGRNSRGGGSIKGASFYIEKLNCLIALTNGYRELRPLLLQGGYTSRGMINLMERLEGELPEERVTVLCDSLHALEFWLRDETLIISAAFSEGMKLGDFRINQVADISSGKKRPEKKRTLREQISRNLLKSNVTMLQEESLIGQEKQLEESVAGWLLTAFDAYLEDALDFFARFYYEASFYLGCANLMNYFGRTGILMCAPEVTEEGRKEYEFTGLYDVSLAIFARHRPVGNTLDTANTDLYIVSGANQGGKSTWLRSVGAAQILMQCGMFVPAQRYKSRLYEDVFTHFSRQEDSRMNSGRFDEELRRMDRIMDHVTRGSVVFLNESFASTTETEGTLILKNITDALYQLEIPVFMVNHLFEYTKEMYQRSKQEKEKKGATRMIFLCAERTERMERTFKIVPAPPSPTSYGLDIYHEMI